MTPKNIIEKLNILLVDDEAFIRKVNAHVLSVLTRRNVLQASSAREAISILDKQSIDLLITDIQMPEMNGLDLMKEIRCGRTRAPAELPILAITSFSNTEVLGSAMGLDVNGFLVKPITPKNALEKINIAMRERINPRATIAYERVMTDLPSLSGGSGPIKETEHRVNSSISRTSTEKAPEKNSKSTKVPLVKLKSGMKLLSELHSSDGVILLASGQLLTEQIINRIKELEKIMSKKEVLVESPESTAQ
jgi:YesN/AraC family two-component response regulator